MTALSCQKESGTLEPYSRKAYKMGTAFEITAVASSEKKARQAVDAAYREVDRIESLISSWDPDSETSAINREAGRQAVTVSRELFDLISRSVRVSALTGGIFDISYASMDRIWKFDGSMDTLPDASEIEASVALVGYENIILNTDRSTVFLKRTGMKIGFGGIGKGYAANRCFDIMRDLGIENGVVNAGGDLVSWGSQANGDPWTIGIANPNMAGSALSWLEISDMAVVTSGNYERFIEVGGKKYSHIINPRTGWPAEALKSVTILCPDAEVADALATAVFIMGVDDGIEFIDGLKDIECFIIDERDSLFHSRNISLEYIR